MTIVASIIIFLNIFANYSHAGIWSTGESWLQKGSSTTVIDTTKSGFQSSVNELSGLLFGMGVVIAVIVVAILGVKYMIASSMEERANIKKTSIIVLVGLLVLFGSFKIWEIVVNLLSSNS
jgi:hypothetical protein